MIVLSLRIGLKFNATNAQNVGTDCLQWNALLTTIPVGHTVARCPNPPAETDGGNGDAGFDAGAGGGDDFNSAPPAADFGSGGAGGDQSWNTADAAAGGW